MTVHRAVRTTARRPVVAGVPLLLAGLVALPAAAGGPPATAPVDGPAPARLATLAASPDASVLRVGPDGQLAREARPLDVLTAPTNGGPTARLRALAAALGAASSTPVLVVLDDGPPAEDGAFEPTSFAIPGGDLNGDGGADVLSYTFAMESTVLQARLGTDGTLLWQQPLAADAGIVFPVGQDLTGDGADDLLVDRWDFIGDVTVSPVGAEYSATIDQTYGVVSGATGAAVWATTVRATIEESSTGVGTGPASAGRYEVTAAGLLLPMLADDLTGDGISDVVVNEVDFAVEGDGAGVGAGPVEAFRYRETYRTSTRGDVVDGRTGTARELRSSTDLRGDALLLPLGDLDGSGTGELVWERLQYPDPDAACLFTPVVSECRDQSQGELRFDAEVLSGVSGQALWAVSPENPFAVLFPLDTDVDGDGVRDLSLEGFDGFSVLSGADGSVLWSHADPEQPRFLLAAVDEVALLLGNAGTEQEPTLLIERRDAASGALLSSDARPLPQAEAPEANTVDLWIYLGLLPDGDGDGGPELLVGAVSHAGLLVEDGEELSYEHLASRSAAVVEPFAGGTPLLQDGGDDERYLFGFDDLDGDGLQDVLRDVVTPVGDDPFGTEATVLRLRDGSELWSFTGSYLELPTPAGDQDGTPGSELLQTDVVDDTTLVVSRRGTDLGCRWAAVPGRPALVGCA